MPRNALEGSAMSHLDDLVSFYWVLCFIIVGHSGPGLQTSRLEGEETPADLGFWSDPRPKSSAHAKRGHLENPTFTLPVQPQFTSLLKLLENLHGFFNRRIRAEHDAVLSPSDARQDFTEFVGYFSQAMEEVDDLLGAVQCIPQKRPLDEQVETTVAKKRSVTVMTCCEWSL